MEKVDFKKLSIEERVEQACFSRDPEVLNHLSKDENIFVRVFVVFNDNTSKETLMEMKKNDEPFIVDLIEI